MATALHLKADGSEAFVPDGAPLPAALARTTHLGIGAHPDDLEIMACHRSSSVTGRAIAGSPA